MITDQVRDPVGHVRSRKHPASVTRPGMTTNVATYNGLDARVGLTDASGSKTFKRAGSGVTSPVLSNGHLFRIWINHPRSCIRMRSV